MIEITTKFMYTLSLCDKGQTPTTTKLQTIFILHALGTASTQ